VAPAFHNQLRINRNLKQGFIVNEKIALIGAGSAMFTRRLVADLIARGGNSELLLIDVDPRSLEVAEGLARKMVQVSGSKLKVDATTKRRYGLSDATAVITAIAVGGRMAWMRDVLIPRQYGIFQPVGDTASAGGASRALRMVPAMLEIARDVEDICPRAVFLNYSNPMSAICHAIHKHTSLTAIGLCHGPVDTANYLADQLQVSRRGFTYTVAGVNHFCWFVDARLDGVDITPRIRAVAHSRCLTRQQQMRLQKLEGLQPFPADSDPFSWEMCRNYGFFPANGDRHVSEFFPPALAEHAYFGHTLGIDNFSFEETISAGQLAFDTMRTTALGRARLTEKFMERKPGDSEFALDVLQAIRQNSGEVFTVNMPNYGQLAQLPAGGIVESPAIASGGTLRPVVLEALNDSLVHQLRRRLEITELLVTAAIKGHRKQFAQALMLEGIVADKAVALSAELLEANKAYLPWVRRRKSR
jgi:alpha-galactosidase